jgi:amino acid efflux transporter
MRYAVALYVSSVLGSGILVIPGLAAKVAGPSSLLAWLALAVLSYPFAYTFASLSVRRPESGGVYSFAKESLGGHTANAVGWLFASWYISGAPAATLVGASYLAYALPLDRTEVFVSAAAMIIISFVINYLGISLSGKVQLGVTVSIVALLLITVVASAPSVRAENFQPFLTGGVGSVGVAAALIIWSYFGYENVSNVAEEFRDPGKDFHRSVLVSVALSSFLYVAVAFVIIGTKAYVAGGSVAPFAAILSGLFGGSVGLGTALLAVFIIFGNLNAYTTGISRVVYAVSKDGGLPSLLSSVHQKYRSPNRSLFFICSGSLIVLFLYYLNGMDIETALLLTNGVGLSVYVAGSVAGIRLLREGGVRRYYPWISLLVSLSLLPFVGFIPLLVILAVVLLSLLHSKIVDRK